MAEKFFVISFLMVLAGCTLFRPSLRKQLLPMEMTKVEGGTFMMGDVIEQKNEDSLPLHEVTLGDYYIGTYEVTSLSTMHLPRQRIVCFRKMTAEAGENVPLFM